VLPGFLGTLVVTVNVLDVVPAATVTLAGTVASDVLDEASVTMAPPAGAAAVSVTVPVDGLPPATLVGLNVSDDSAAAGTGLSVSTVDLFTPL